MPADEVIISEELLGVLACPEDRGPLTWDGAERVLRNPRLGRTYPSLGRVPQLTLSAASSVDAARSAASGADRCS